MSTQTTQPKPLSALTPEERAAYDESDPCDYTDPVQVRFVEALLVVWRSIRAEKAKAAQGAAQDRGAEGAGR